jgi:hypothetical protein
VTIRPRVLSKNFSPQFMANVLPSPLHFQYSK